MLARHAESLRRFIAVTVVVPLVLASPIMYSCAVSHVIGNDNALSALIREMDISTDLKER